MEKNSHTMLTAFRLIFRPIARIMLRAGITWKELAEVGKAVYVEVASADFGIRGRPTNVSRVSILTGFTRKEVSRLRKVLTTDEGHVMERMNRATRVLTGWFTDAEFVDDDGNPRALAVAGDDVSFESLCRRFASDVPPTTMLKELKHVQAVSENKAGMLEAMMRTYMPQKTDPSLILSSGSVLEDIGNTVTHNLFRGDGDLPRFERRATNTRVSAKAKAKFQEYLEKEGQAFLERVDEWLTEHEVDGDGAGETIRLGLGTYWIEE